MGMSVVTICDGEIDRTFHCGLKDFTRWLSVDDSTMYRIASISKSITATGFMLLYDDGLFEFDDDISDHLGYLVRNPNYPDTPITVGMVLSHQSSLQDGDGYSPFLTATYASDPVNISEVLLDDGNYYTSNMWRLEEPGTYFAYSNINFGLAATLMEAISGERFDQFMKAHLFEPMGLAGSYNVADIENIDNLAVLYRNQGGWTPQVDNYQGNAPSQPNLPDYVPGTNGSRFAPQGGLRMSAIDLAKLAQLHLNGGMWEDSQLIEQSTIELMHSLQWTDNGSNGDDYYNLFNQWGYGIQSTINSPGGDIVVDGKTMYGHPGEAYGLISDWYFEKVDKAGIVFLTNGAYDGFSWGNYSAFYTLEEAIFTTFEDHAYDVCAVSVKDKPEQIVSIYPNPTSDLIRISLPSAHEQFQIEIFDMCSRLIGGHTIAGSQTAQVDCQEFVPGTYLIKVYNENFAWSDSLIIK